MIAHIVLLRPRRDLTPADRQAFAATFEKALQQIPVVRGARVGKRRVLDRFYDNHNAESYPYIAIIEFDSEQQLRAYLDHPAHDELGRRFYEIAEVGLAFDYEMKEARGAGDWLIS